jgi:hypothetical protein
VRAARLSRRHVDVLPLVRIKDRERAEIARLVDEFLDNGGEITRDARAGQRVELRCECCGRVGMVLLEIALRRKHCPRCGSDRVVAAR